MSMPLLDATGGPTTQDVQAVRTPPQRHRPKQRSWRVRRSAADAHQQQLQQPDIQQTCQSQRREPLLGLRGGFRLVLGAEVSVPGFPARTV